MQFNYGGIRAKFQTEPPITNTEGDSQVEIVACWNMAEHLTKDIQVCYSSEKVIPLRVNKMSVKVAQMYCDTKLSKQSSVVKTGPLSLESLRILA